MDHYAMLAHPLEGVFRHLATPEYLADWLPEVAQVQAGTVPPGVGDAFSLVLGLDGQKMAATGELIAYEPPWSAAYRLLTGSRIHVMRVICTSGPGTTRVHVRQSDGLPPLVVDLGRLGRALDTTGPATPPGIDETNDDG